MRLQDIMTSAVETIGEYDSAIQANERMWRKQIHHLVVMRNHQIVGVVSDTDLGGDGAEEIPNNLLVKDVMSTKVVTVKPNTKIREASNLMQGNQIHCLPILNDEGYLVGIVTKTDIEMLEKRGTAHEPFQGLEPIDPDVYSARRDDRGKSKVHHTEWPRNPKRV